MIKKSEGRNRGTQVLYGSMGLQERIRLRAYELFEERGREHGHDIEDWLRAEAEITGNATRAAA